MKGIRSFISALLVAVMILGVTGNTVKAAEDEDDNVIRLSVEKCVLKPGKKLRIHVENAEDAKITYTSRDTEVATVSKLGKITAINEGTTSIIVLVTISDDEGTETTVKLKCKVKVEEEKVVTLMAVGDALIHENILKSGKTKKGKYNYDALFENITDYIADFDVKIINQETIFINDSSQFAGYPCFGTPKELGDSMRKAGFNVITCATNHAYDKGARGIKDTGAYWKQYEDSVIMTGIYDSQESYDTLSIREYNGIKIAFLNYTTLVNSGSKREPYYIRYYKESQALKEIAKAKKKADFVIVLPHWGIEYDHDPSSEQKTMAKKMAEAGADAIIGCHPHVVQPMKVIKTSDGRRVPCFYSLGNFVSNMFWFKTQLEGMAELEIVKWNGETTVRKAKQTPLVNHVNGNDTEFTAYLLADYDEDVCKKHYMNQRFGSGAVTIKRLKELFNSIGNDKW